MVSMCFSQWTKEPRELVQWARNPNTRARDECSFWDAHFDVNSQTCVCTLDGYDKTFGLSRFCLWSHAQFSYPDDFNPVFVMQHFPVMDLWNPKCKCVKYEDEFRDRPTAIHDVTAVEFCNRIFVTVHNKNYHLVKKWHRKYLVRLRDAIVKGVQEVQPRTCQQLIVDDKKINSILPQRGNLIQKLFGGRRRGNLIQKLLGEVCHDECEGLVKEIRNKQNAKNLADLAVEGQGSYRNLCSSIIVKKVESRILGCCGRACGWNGRTCCLANHRTAQGHRSKLNEVLV